MDARIQTFTRQCLFEFTVIIKLSNWTSYESRVLVIKKKIDNPECKITMFRKGLIGLLCIENEVFVQRIP